MPNYRRACVPGGTYFFTVVTHQRRPLFDMPANVQRLRTALRRTRAAYPFRIDAIVILPDHLHALWTLPDGDDDHSRRWRLAKTLFTQSSPEDVPGERVRRPGERSVWQRGYWEHLIRNEEDYQRHMDYIHYNPVKHGLVTQPVDWPYSSFHRAVRNAWYPPDWGACEPATVAGMEFE